MKIMKEIYPDIISHSGRSELNMAKDNIKIRVNASKILSTNIVARLEVKGILLFVFIK